MTEVGRLIQGILSVKHNGKWKRRFCTLEKQATFTNSLKFIVAKQDEGPCLLQDVVHAYLWSLDPHHPGTIMLICNYKVRCISFDQFDELNNWVDVLKTYLTCNYFHADLILASKESCLYNHARRRKRQLRQATQSRKLASVKTTQHNGSSIFRVPPTVRDDGYLHVTRDRICYTTSPGCGKPKLLATWSFDNDELVQCFTGRTVSDDPADGDKVNLFCLTASADHPEAPGGHLFISDRASELCEWIEANNQTAIYQAEWRRLTSMVATLDTPFTSRMSCSFPSSVFGPRGPVRFGSLLGANFGDYTSLLNIDLGSSELRYPEESPDEPLDTRETVLQTDEQKARTFLSSAKQRDHDAETVSIESQSVSSLSNMSSTVEQPIGAQDVQITGENNAEPNNTASAQSRTVASNSVTSESKPEVKFVFPSALARAEFLARKRIAMHSRRRFSSQPVDTRGPPNLAPTFIPSGFLSSKGPSSCSAGSNSIPGGHQNLWNFPDDSARCLSDQLSNPRPLCSQWRQSDPQLVTLPPFPVPLRDLNEFLHRYKCALSQSSAASPPPPHSSRAPGDASCSHRRMSQCSSANSVTSQQQQQQPGSCPKYDGEASCDVFDPSVAPAAARNRLPSSWSSATAAGTNSSQWVCQSLLNQCQSSGSSPQCSVTPLLPTASLVPGSQHFSRRRKHTASASEAIPAAGGLRSLQPVRQRAVSIMEQRFTVAPESSSSARLSLVSLSPLSVPVWADAPLFAKPRTGHNYVSREAVLASHAQRKLRYQQERATTPTDQLPRQPPSAGPPLFPSTSEHSPTGNLSSMGPPPSSSTEPTVIPANSCNSRHTVTTICHPYSAQLTQQSTSNVPIYVDSVSSQISNGEHLSRSYVNMGPTSTRRTELQPIAESQPLLSACTDPIVRLRQPGVSNCNSHSATALSTYVNVSPPPTQPYVNMPPILGSPNKSSGRGLRSIPSNTEQYGLKQKFSAPNLINEGVASTTCLFTTSSNNHLATNDSTSSPQIHYALLTLSTNEAASTTHPPAPIECPSSGLNPGPSSSSVDTAPPEQDGVKYVTIDLVQTKALSELEQELRSSTLGANAGESSLQSNWTGWGFRHSRRGRANSVLLSMETGRVEEIDNQKRPPDRGNNKRNPMESGSATTPLSLPARVLTRLAQSIHLHPAIGRKPNSSQTPRRRFSLLSRKTGGTLSQPISRLGV